MESTQIYQLQKFQQQQNGLKIDAFNPQIVGLLKTLYLTYSFEKLFGHLSIGWPTLVLIVVIG